MANTRMIEGGKAVLFHLPEAQHAWLKAYAAERQVSASQVIRELIAAKQTAEDRRLKRSA